MAETLYALLQKLQSEVEWKLLHTDITADWGGMREGVDYAMDACLALLKDRREPEPHSSWWRFLR